MDQTGEGSTVQTVLGSGWVFWDRLQAEGARTNENYNDSMTILFTFDKLEEFAMFWKATPYSRLSNLFYDLESRELKRFKIGDDEKSVDGMLLFRKGVQPKWEDPANCFGCSLSCEIIRPSVKCLDNLWKDLVFRLVGEEFPVSDSITGLRVLDRLRKNEFIKVELWLNIPLQKTRLTPEVYETNKVNFDNVFRHFLETLQKSFPLLTENHIITNDHYRANRA